MARSKPGRTSRHKTVALKRIPEFGPWFDEIIRKVEVPSYIDHDPICFMHMYSGKQDRLLAGFLAAIMAWGRRDIVISKVGELMERMNHQPEKFIRNYSPDQSSAFDGFKHRTFTAADVDYLVTILSKILHEYHDFENFWADVRKQSIAENRELIAVFHERFFNVAEGPWRTRKHIADSEKNSSCKRLYLYLRWAVRKNSVVDTGLMNFMPQSELMIPLDVHVARQARILGLLGRKQNDWKAVTELTRKLRILDPDDPGKYDYALFGIGVLNLEVPENFIVNKRIK